MSSDWVTEAAQHAGVEVRPESVTSEGLPIAMRGYDRERVDRLLSRVSEAYLQLWRQREALRERLTALETDLEAAEAEARVSAKSVGELVQRVSTIESEHMATRKARDELTERLRAAEAGHRRAVAELQATSERAGESEKRVQASEEALGSRPLTSTVRSDHALAIGIAGTPPAPESAASETEEAARLLLAAARASDVLRETARAQAHHAIKKARKRAAALSAETERERIVLAEMQERRRHAEHEAEEVLARARTDADRVAAVLDEERDRVRSLLTGALALLDQGVPDPPEGLVADLSSRLRDSSMLDPADTLFQARESNT